MSFRTSQGFLFVCEYGFNLDFSGGERSYHVIRYQMMNQVSSNVTQTTFQGSISYSWDLGILFSFS